MKRILFYWPILVFILIFIVLFISNFQPNTYLLGWDVSIPEFNLKEHWSRTLWSAWQEYRGLGSVDYFANATNIGQLIIVSFLSLFLPQQVVRYFFILTCHFVGGIGLFLLLKNDLLLTFTNRLAVVKKRIRGHSLYRLKELISQHQHSSLFKRSVNNYPFLANIPSKITISQKKFQINNYSLSLTFSALIASLFYQFNLMTIQIFHLPYELFVIHFAVLPWGVYSLRKYLKTGQIKALIFFIFVNLLAITQAFVPTLFLTYALLIALILLLNIPIIDLFKYLYFLLICVFRKKSHISTFFPYRFIKKIRLSIIAGLVFFILNSFWFFPYLYTFFNQSAEITQAKMNRYSTRNIFYRNAAWGDFDSLMRFGGLHLGFNAWNFQEQNFQAIMKDWLSWYQDHRYRAISYFFSVLIIIGFLLNVKQLIKQKNNGLNYLLLILFLVLLLMLGSNLPIFKVVAAYFRQNILFFQIFRFTFTKFSMLFVFIASIFLGIFFTVFFNNRFFINSKKARYFVIYPVFLLSIFLIFSLAYPAFKNNFFYSQLKVNLPHNYQQLFSYLADHDQESRILPLPIHSFWGWTTNSTNWGYSGSGFVWQAIHQPILDRAFDWSSRNETAFNQLNRALYTLDHEAFIKYLNKYHLNLLLLDQSIFHPGNYQEALFIEEMKNFFNDLQAIQVKQQFDFLTLYQTNGQENNLHLSLPSQITLIGKDYQNRYTSYDQAYVDYGDYLQAEEQEINGQLLKASDYPFSWFQKEEIKREDQRDIQLTQSQLVLPLVNDHQKEITFPNLKETNQAIPAYLKAKKVMDQVELSLELILPEVWQNDQAILEYPASTTLQFPFENHQDFFVTIADYIYEFNVDTIHSEPTTLAVLALPLKEQQLKVFSNESSYYQDITDIFKQQSIKTCHRYPNYQPAVSARPEALLLSAINADACLITDLNFGVEPADYLLSISAQYRSTTQTAPDLCLADQDETIYQDQARACENFPSFDYFTASQNWQPATIVVPVDTQNQYQLKLINHLQNFNQQQEIEYDQIKFFLNPLISKKIINLNQMIDDYDHQLQNLSVSASDLEIRFQNTNGKQNLLAPTNNRSLFKSEAQNCADQQLGEINKYEQDQSLIFSAGNKGRLCDQQIVPYLDYRLEYLFWLKGQGISGSGLEVYLINPLTKRFDLEIVTADKDFDSFYPVYPSAKQAVINNQAFRLNLVLESFGFEENKVRLDQAAFITLPLSWLNKIQLKSHNQTISFNQDNQIVWQKKLSSSLYLTKITLVDDQAVLLLPQAFDQAWVGISLAWPVKILEHEQLNGWANVWKINQQSPLILLIYWPQLLIFLGYAFLLILIIGIVIQILRRHF